MKTRWPDALLESNSPGSSAHTRQQNPAQAWETELRFCWRTGAGAGERVSAWAGSLQHRSSPVPRKGSQGLCRARLRAPARGSPRGCRGEDMGLGPGLALSGHRKPCTHPRGPESLPSRSHVGHGAHVCPQTHLLQDRAPRELLCVGGSVSESGTRQVQIQIPALLLPGCAILDKCLDFSDPSSVCSSAG